MIYEEFCQAVWKAKRLWQQIWCDLQATHQDLSRRSCPADLVICGEAHRFGNRANTNAHAKEMEIRDIDGITPANAGSIFQMHSWLGLGANISPFNIELRFHIEDLNLKRMVRFHPKIRDLNDQLDDSIAVVLYRYKGKPRIDTIPSRCPSCASENLLRESGDYICLDCGFNPCT